MESRIHFGTLASLLLTIAFGAYCLYPSFSWHYRQPIPLLIKKIAAGGAVDISSHKLPKHP
jgi:hypothetical protein